MYGSHHQTIAQTNRPYSRTTGPAPASTHTGAPGQRERQEVHREPAQPVGSVEVQEAMIMPWFKVRVKGNKRWLDVEAPTERDVVIKHAEMTRRRPRDIQMPKWKNPFRI